MGESGCQSQWWGGRVLRSKIRTYSRLSVQKMSEQEVHENVKSQDDHAKWYEENIGVYESLAKSISQTLRDLLESEGVDFVEIKCRKKSKESFLEKVLRKQYTDLAVEMTDLAGIRVIVLLESDIKKVSDLLSNAFSIHADDSGDKSKDLGLDRVGYRSVHFVCDIGVDRANLSEFKRFKDKCFEIQVRTVLQNTWADIAHARSYKLKGKIPDDLNRRLNLISGMLELVDLELSSLTKAIEEHRSDAIEKIDSGNADAVQITSASLKEYLRGEFKIDEFFMDSVPEIFDELRSFGIFSIGDLDRILVNNIRDFKGYVSSENYLTDIGLIRHLLMYEDFFKYFEHSWQLESFGFINGSSGILNLLFKKYGKERVVEVLESKEIKVV